MNILPISNNNFYVQKSKNAQPIRPLKRCGQISFGTMDIPFNTYFIKMATYRTNPKWAKKMLNATEVISDKIRKKSTFTDILSTAENSIREINDSKTTDISYWGLRKTACGQKGTFLLTNVPKTRGYEYYQKYINIIKDMGIDSFYYPKSNSQYKNAMTCEIVANNTISIYFRRYIPRGIRSNLEFAEQAYNLLLQKEKPTKKEIVDTAATIQWLIAQETPYVRGSDSIANLLTRSLMHSHDIQISPLKPEVSCDFEAFYRDLDDYIKIYPTLFEKNPLL